MQRGGYLEGNTETCVGWRLPGRDLRTYRGNLSDLLGVRPIHKSGTSRQKTLLQGSCQPSSPESEALCRKTRPVYIMYTCASG